MVKNNPFPLETLVRVTGLSLLLFFLGSDFVFASSIKTGHLNHFVISQSKHLSRLDGNTALQLSLVFQLNHQDQLEAMIRRMQTPGDPLYGQYMTPDQFRLQFAPTSQQLAQAVGALKALGLSAKVHENGTLININNSALEVERAFNVEFHQFQMADGRIAYSTTMEPTLPDELMPLVHGISGLDSFAHPHPSGHFTSNAAAATDLTPTQIQHAYGIDSILATGVTGTGLKIGLVEFDSYFPTDVAAYATHFNIANPATVTKVNVDGFSGTPTAFSGSGTPPGSFEATLDVEMMVAVLPTGSQIYMYEAANSAQAYIDVVAKIASDNIVKVVSTSWGAYESFYSTATTSAVNNSFMQMAAQGQTVVDATGDFGAYYQKTTLSSNFPGTSPYVLAVGGTRLTNDASGNYLSETSWNTAANGATPALGGGGGISTLYTIPSWQSSLGIASNKGSVTMRMIPDVSLVSADTSPYYGFYAGASGDAYGTSFATPIWAVVLALVDQQRAKNGTATLGLVNPAIYQLARSSLYATLFHDISDNSTNMFYPATSGYDLSTGWGSMIGLNLFNSLVNPVLPPFPPTALTVTSVSP